LWLRLHSKAAHAAGVMLRGVICNGVGHGARGLAQRRVLVQAMAQQGQPAMGCIDFGLRLLESEGAHGPMH